MFWSDKNQGYELPYSERQNLHPKKKWVSTATGTSVFQPQTHGNTSFHITHYWFKHHRNIYACVVNSDYEHKKKDYVQMSKQRRGDDHKDAVYFTSKECFGPLSTERGWQC